ncbi:MAG: SDR family oxidoreductase [Hyphomonadaceae bacterium]|nr:SDR family oxidoreductase [Hyphomonadaceae bacterium]MBC6411664.1 SDR family oxidoreductase [Hyphomonadaceae bacterium]
MKPLMDRTVIVTGAAQGIGACLAQGLAGAGANVVVADVLDGEAVVADISRTGGQAIAATTDITSDESLAAMMEQARDSFGTVDILVNNAALFGTLPLTPLDEISLEDWDQVMRVNVRGPWQCVKAVLPDMKAKKEGSIINIATNRVYMGFPNMLHYDASKGAVVAMTKAMATELGAYNIRVNGVAPGLTLSENVLRKEGIGERNAIISASRALARSQQPEDLVGAVLFFAGPHSDFISGQTLIVDGGGIMN